MCSRNEDAETGSAANVWRQWRAQRSGASPLHAGVRPAAERCGLGRGRVRPLNDPTAGAPGWFAGVLRFADACESCVGLKLGIAGPRWFTELRLPKMVQ